MSAFLFLISVIYMILVFIKPQKFGAILGTEARLKSLFIVIIILFLASPSTNNVYNDIKLLLLLFNFFWSILALKNPSNYASFLGENLRRLKIIGIWIAVCIILSIVFPTNKETPLITANSTSSSESIKTEQKQQSTDKKEQKKTMSKQSPTNNTKKPKKIVHDYFHLSEKYIQEIYRATYQSQGLGIPEVDCRYMTYRDWDIVDGKMQVSEGTFYLGGNKNIEHTYKIRWRNKTGQPLSIVINEQQYFLDKEAQMAAYDD